MLDKIGIAFILAILFLFYAVAKPTGAAEVLIGLMAGAGLSYLAVAICQWLSHRVNDR